MNNSVKEFWDEKYTDFDATVEVRGNLDTAGYKIDLDGKSILIIACGTGEHVVRAARQGARVTALDISSKAVDNAKAIMKRHSLEAEYVIADAVNTGLPAGAFDIVWGSAVLHHLAHESTAKEIARIVKKDGSVFFLEEPTFFNPVLKFFYEQCFGKGREGRRRKFLFLERRGDEFEKPIDREDVSIWARYFEVEKSPHELMFIEKFAHVSPIPRESGFYEFFRWLDRVLFKLFPALKKYSYEYDFIMTPK